MSSSGMIQPGEEAGDEGERQRGSGGRQGRKWRVMDGWMDGCMYVCMDVWGGGVIVVVVVVVVVVAD